MSDRRKLLRDLAVLLIVLLPWFLALLGARPLNVPDEGRYPEVAREMLMSGDFITPRVNGALFLDKPALYYWLQAASFAVFGVSIASVRLMPALFGVAGCLLVFVAGWRFFNRRTAWLAALTMAASPLYFLASQYANLDLEVAVWITAALFGFLFAQAEPVDSPRRRLYFALAYLAGGFGVLTKGLIGIVLPAIAIFAWMLWRRRWRDLPRWSLPLLPIGVLAVCLPWYTAVQLHNPQFLHFFFVYQQFERFSGGGFNNALPAWFYPAILALGLLPWTFWLPAALKRAWQQRGEAGDLRAFLLAWPAVILLFFSLPTSKIAGYILPVVPPLALLLGAYLDEWLDAAKGRNWLPRISAVVLIALALVAFFSAGKEWQHPQRALQHPELPWLLLGMGATLLAGALACLSSLRGKALHAVIGLVLAGIGLCAWAVPLVPCYDKESIRTTAARMLPKLTADTVIVNYRNYFQDLPLYLNRHEPIRVVDDWTDPNIVKVDNWRREFFYALKDQPEARGWLLDEAAFAALLRGPRPVMVVLTSDLADEVQRRYQLQEVSRTPRFVVLSR
ncbi:phospholipid carrier-dependent glycosyltransferase [Chitinimonas sp.]|uniref:phospholipid carrier-dependent glycosyltransferase n=1 Tax=Chitinimonas sp. TaxID=1934313 RepID=UPI0035B0C079